MVRTRLRTLVQLPLELELGHKGLGVGFDVGHCLEEFRTARVFRLSGDRVNGSELGAVCAGYFDVYMGDRLK